MLCGCMGYKEIDKGYLVTAVGISNKNDNAGIFIEAISASDTAKGENERIVLASNGNDIYQAYSNLKTTLVKPLYFEQLGAVIIEGYLDDGLNFIKQIPNINYGIYITKTDDVKLLFESYSAKGLLGYDIISLIKTQQKQNAKKLSTQYFEIQNTKNLPTINILSGKLIIEFAGCFD